MKKLILCIAILSGVALGQVDLDAPQDYIANTVTLLLQNPPQQVNAGQVSVSLIDNPGPATYCYWIVSNFLIGNSQPAGPFCVTNGPNAITTGIRIAWSPVNGALSYDVLRTTSTQVPTGACGCAVATAVSGITQVDSGAGLNAYTVSTFIPNTRQMVIDNEQLSSGVSQLAFRFNGLLVFAAQSNGAITLPSTVVQTNQSNVYTTGTQDFSSATLLKARLGAGLTTSTNGDFGYDTTSKNWHFFDNGADSINVVTTSAPTNGDCVNWSNVAGTVTAGDAGAPCDTTTGTQTLTNKNLSGDTLSGTTTNTGTVSGGTLSGNTINAGTVTGGLAGLTPSFQQFTSSGTFTIPSGVTAVKLTVVGGGAAGGGSGVTTNSGGGGGAGGSGIKFLSGLTPGNTLAVTVGTGGTGNANAAGGNGTASSVSSGTQTITTITANGGSGGSQGSASAGTGGSAGSGGDLNFGGNAGCPVGVIQGSSNSQGGCGAGSIFGGGGAPGTGPANGSAPGAGGGGSTPNGSTTNPGGNGANGIVIFEWVK